MTTRSADFRVGEAPADPARYAASGASPASSVRDRMLAFR